MHFFNILNWVQKNFSRAKKVPHYETYPKEMARAPDKT